MKHFISFCPNLKQSDQCFFLYIDFSKPVPETCRATARARSRSWTRTTGWRRRRTPSGRSAATRWRSRRRLFLLISRPTLSARRNVVWKTWIAEKVFFLFATGTKKILKIVTRCDTENSDTLTPVRSERKNDQSRKSVAKTRKNFDPEWLSTFWKRWFCQRRGNAHLPQCILGCLKSLLQGEVIQYDWQLA